MSNTILSLHSGVAGAVRIRGVLCNQYKSLYNYIITLLNNCIYQFRLYGPILRIIKMRIKNIKELKLFIIILLNNLM